MKKRIVLGMSGGVDSSVSAFLLKEMGYDVVALFMKNWEEDGKDGCTQEADAEDVAKVCSVLNIPFYAVNFVKEYRERVFNELIEGLKKGVTPNPDILCNKEIKFRAFYEQALRLGADFLATGHYARTDETFHLLKGIDPTKDQSYFLYAIDGECLKKTLFPIGHLEKTRVRQIAKQANLPTFNKKDSTGICFIGNNEFKKFISQYIRSTKGRMYDLETGRFLQEHEGAVLFTVGERARIGGLNAPYYIAKKEGNDLFLVQGQNHPLLFEDQLTAQQLHWIQPLTNKSFRATAKIRYRQEDQPCTVTIKNDLLTAKFDTPQRAITPGQSIVIYQNDLCLGGGIID